MKRPITRESSRATRPSPADPDEALAEYRFVLANHAGRARSLLGAARAAAKTGDAAASRDFYRKLVGVWSEADEGTEGLSEARQAAAARP